MIKTGKVLLAILFTIYLLILTKYIWFKFISPREILEYLTFSPPHEYWAPPHNFVPFQTIQLYLFKGDINLNIRIDNLVGNVLGFVPLGFMLPLIFSKLNRLWVVLLASFGLSLFYESGQMVFQLGSFDVDDLMLNTLGGLIGYLPVRYAWRYFVSQEKNTGMRIKLGLSAATMLALMSGIRYM
ncbi:VanZ family protein [Marinicrinis sediminis]|uniref:VanZ family protein n=1 Tax=Marinicrinis sediminis TaxID=1652465 RepID=A0ABW5R8T2_9BACL